MRSWREKRAAALLGDGLECLDDMDGVIGVDPFSMRVALEYAGIPWRFEATGAACSGDGDEHDAPEVWVDPWVLPLVYGLAMHPSAPLEPAGNLSNRTVAESARSTKHFGVMLQRAHDMLTDEDRAALLAIYALVVREDHRVLVEFLAARGVFGTITVPPHWLWQAAHDRVRATGDWRPDSGEADF